METANLIYRTLRRFEPWVVGFFFFYFSGVDIFTTLGLESILNVLSYGVLLALLAGCWRQVLRALTLDIPLLLLHGLGLASVLWSAAPEFTSDESKTVVRAALFGVYLAVRFGLKGTIKIIRWPIGIGVVASLLSGIIFPSHGIHWEGEWVGAWKGIYAFKNLFASQMLQASVLFMVLGLGFKKYRYWLLAAVAVFLLVLSRGKTSLAAFVISIYLLPLYLFAKQPARLRSFMLISILALTLISVAIIALNLELIVVDWLGKDLEFNGRLPVWTLMLEQGAKQFWFGYGYAGFWTSGSARYILTHTWAAGTVAQGLRFNGHSGFLDLFLQLGFVGIACLLISYFLTLWKTFNLLLRSHAVEFFWSLMILLVMVFLNLADTLSMFNGGADWSIYIACATCVSLEYRKIHVSLKYQNVHASLKASDDSEEDCVKSFL